MERSGRSSWCPTCERWKVGGDPTPPLPSSSSSSTSISLPGTTEETKKKKRKGKRGKKTAFSPIHYYYSLRCPSFDLEAAGSGAKRTWENVFSSLSFSLSLFQKTRSRSDSSSSVRTTFRLSLSLSSLEKIWNIGLQGKKRFKRRGRACLMEGGALFFSSRTYLRNKVKGSFLLKRERLDKAVTGWWIYL